MSSNMGRVKSNMRNTDHTKPYAAFKSDLRLIGGLVPDAWVWLGPTWLNLRFSLVICLSVGHEPFSLSS